MKELYPCIKPFNSFHLEVGDVHNLYVEECGNPAGQAVLFLHGGPGGGINESYPRYFDPKKYRIILFDQRGCGKSKPFASLESNTTWDLVEDINKIKTHLNIERWAVFGGSWGSTLSLAYAQTYPESVDALFLRGIFLLRQKEINWFYQEGASKIFPDAWEKFIEPIPMDKRENFIKAYYEILTGNDEDLKVRAAKAWSVWEASTSKLIQDDDLMSDFGDPEFAIAFSRIECHYFINKGFFNKESLLLDNVDKIRHIPTTIVQGRYDVVCPMESSWELHRAFPEAKYVVIDDAGHSLSEMGIASALIEATDEFVS